MVSLTPEQIARKNYLLSLFQTRTITRADTEELKKLLEIEKSQATSLGDVLAAFGVAVLIGLVIAYLADDDR